MSQPESPISWVLRILPSCNIPPQVASWNEINMKISELRRIQNQDLTTGALYCPAPNCSYKCEAPRDMDPTDTVLCPHHSAPMTVMTWKQMSEQAAMTMVNMQRVIDEKEGMLQAFTERHLQLTEQLNTMAAQAIQAARLMQDAQKEAKEAQERLDSYMFMDANMREELDRLREWRYGPLGGFVAGMADEIHFNRFKGDWDKWKPEMGEIQKRMGSQMGKLCNSIRKRNLNAVRKFAADIGTFLIKTIQLYGTPSKP